MSISDISRFMRLVDIDENTGCWIWRGGKNPHYGVFRIGSLKDGTRRMTTAHRWAYEHFNGPIPEGLFVCHKCDVKACANPEHLFLGTNSENIMDAVRKGVKIGGANIGEKNGRAVLDESKVKAIRARNKSGESMSALAKEYGVSNTQISWIVNRKSWAHVA